jgi:hypothetical protein
MGGINTAIVAKFKLVDIQDANVAEKLARTRRTELSPDMVVPARLERATSAFGRWRSAPLSHGTLYPANYE